MLSPVLPDPARLNAVLITSHRAAMLPQPLRALPLLAVGDASATAARVAGFARVDSAAGDGEALLALAKARLPPSARLLLATGRGQGRALTIGLRAAGFIVIRRAVYAAIPVGRLPETAVQALKDGRVDAAMFFSGEAARCFARLVRAAGLDEHLRKIDALSISAAAAVALQGLAWRQVRIAARPNQEAMIALLT